MNRLAPGVADVVVAMDQQTSEAFARAWRWKLMKAAARVGASAVAAAQAAKETVANER